jgi:hypothetical protein
MPIDRAIAATLMLGSILFLAAAFSPISRIFGIRDAGQRLEIITAAPVQWLVAQVLFALGAIVTVAGVGLLAYRLAGESYSVYLSASAAIMGFGALLWSWHVYLRAVDPARFTAGAIPGWLFAGYVLLTIVGLALLGAALLQTGLPSWLGWLSIGAAALFLALGAIFGDLPPLVFYLVTLTLGITLFRLAVVAPVAAPVVG